jgi:hypothetical protein
LDRPKIKSKETAWKIKTSCNSGFKAEFKNGFVLGKFINTTKTRNICSRHRKSVGTLNNKEEGFLSLLFVLLSLISLGVLNTFL